MFDAFAGGGLKFGGWIPGRAEDEFGIAISAAFTSDSWRRATGGGSAEVAIETSYRARLTPWLSIQPSAHYIRRPGRSEEHTSELQSLMRISYAVFCLKKKKQITLHKYAHNTHTNYDNRPGKTQPHNQYCNHFI